MSERASKQLWFRRFTAALRETIGFRWVLAGVPLALAIGLTAYASHPGAESSGPGPSRSAVSKALHSLSIPFVVNEGQSNSQVGFYARTLSGAVFVTRDGALVTSFAPGATSKKKTQGWALVERPVGAGGLSPTGQGAAVAHVSVYHGSDSNRWRSDLPTFREVRLGEPWPGVTLAYQAHGNGVERIFTLAPGISAGEIHMRLKGALQLSLRGGELLAQTGVGAVRLSRPRAYQEIDGERLSVPVSYTLKDDSYGFSIGAHDPARPVVIDPILRTTYLGTPNYEDPFGMALGPDGTVYVTGTVWSDGFPGSTGGAIPYYSGHGDAFVSRLSPDLSRVLQSTYLGGTDKDNTLSIAIAPDTGAVYVAGRTASTDFPGTAGGAQPNYGGGDYDAFVSVFNRKLTRLIQSTYLGGSQHDADWSILISPDNGDVYIGGSTSSTDFPGTASGAQPNYGGGDQDAFIAMLTPDLKHLVRATYLGGSDKEVGFGLAYSAGYGLYFVGGTWSADFPGTSAPGRSSGHGNILDGQEDAFVARFMPNLEHLVHAHVFGGSAADEAHTVLYAPLPREGEIYIGGTTNSTDFPKTAGAAQATYGGGLSDAFVAVMGVRINRLIRATYIGGNAKDDGRAALVFDPVSRAIYAGGMTRSTDLPATAGGAQPYCRDLQRQGQVCNKGDAYIAKLSPSLGQFMQVTYLGGDFHDGGHVLAVDPTTGNIYMAFGTKSDDLLYTHGSAQPDFAGGPRDVAISILTPDLQAAP